MYLIYQMHSVLFESNRMSALSNHDVTLIRRVDKFAEYFLRHVERHILIPLSQDKKRRNTKFFRVPDRLADAQVIGNIFEHTIRGPYHRRTALCANWVGCKGRLPPQVKPGGRADFLNPLGWDSANPSLAYGIPRRSAVCARSTERRWRLQDPKRA